MSLYRASIQSDYMVLLELVDSAEEAMLIISKNYSKVDVFYNYYSRLPVDSTCITRFGYLNCPRRPLYLSEVMETSLYEFSYWILKNPHELNHGPLKAYIYKLDMSVMNNLINLTIHPDLDKIMDINDANYVSSHAFMKKLSSLPDFIIYPSIRVSKHGSLNLAYFNGEVEEYSISSILSISKDRKKPTERVHIVSSDATINGFYEPVR